LIVTDSILENVTECKKGGIIYGFDGKIRRSIFCQNSHAFKDTKNKLISKKRKERMVLK
jgi:hypothetical protein